MGAARPSCDPEASLAFGAVPCHGEVAPPAGDADAVSSNAPAFAYVSRDSGPPTACSVACGPPRETDMALADAMVASAPDGLGANVAWIASSGTPRCLRSGAASAFESRDAN